MFKHLIILVFLALVIFTTPVSAEVPFVFQPNTPAKASEVNENFGFLDGLITDVDSRLTAVESVLTSNFNSRHNVSYTYISSVPGDLVTDIAGGQWRIMRLPFSEFSTNDIYAVTMPVMVEVNDSGNISLNNYIHTNHTNRNSCSAGEPVTIGGIEGTYYVSDTRSIRYNSRDTSSSDTVTFASNNYYYLQICLLIDETYVSFPGVSIRDTEFDFDETTLAIDDYDLVDNIADYSDLNHNPEIIQILDDMFDYFHIEKI